MRSATGSRCLPPLAATQFFLAILGWLAAGPVALADQRAWDAAALYSAASSSRLHLEPAAPGAPPAIVLQRGVLIEDDGPAAGFSYLPNEEQLAPGVLLKKELVGVDPRAAGALLLAAPGGKLDFRINGAAAALASAGKQGNYWQAYRLDPRWLRPGANQIEIGGSGNLWIARDEDYAAGSLDRLRHPNRSAKSSDGGQTWSDSKLGTQADVDGEYLVRLHLDQFQPLGRLISPVIDARALAGAGWPLADSLTSAVRLEVDAETPPQTTLTLRARRGETLDPQAAQGWSAWRELPASGGELLGRGPWVQFELVLGTKNPLVTPRLKGVTLAAEAPRAPEWTKRYRLAGSLRRELVRSAIPFRYEPFDRPELKRLREEYRLDDVVRGARTEWELMQKLSAWSATRWEKGHLKEIYPAWNALEILRPHADGKPIGGFCQQYNLVFLQACESFGLVGRIVSVSPAGVGEKFRSGHETVELWSNEFAKWVHLDGNTAWYFVDAGVEIPLSLLELRDRQLAALAGQPHAQAAVRRTAETSWKWDGLTGWPPFAEQRLIPRSNFLAERAPLPLNQGMRGWFWTGHYHLSDGQAPRSLLFSEVVERRKNFECTPGVVEFALVPQTSEHLVHVRLASETPGLAGYLAKLDSAAETPVSDGFAWTLHPGKNRLELRTRNSAERRGPVSWIELEGQSP